MVRGDTQPRRNSLQRQGVESRRNDERYRGKANHCPLDVGDDDWQHQRQSQPNQCRKSNTHGVISATIMQCRCLKTKKTSSISSRCARYCDIVFLHHRCNRWLSELKIQTNPRRSHVAFFISRLAVFVRKNLNTTSLFNCY